MRFLIQSIPDDNKLNKLVIAIMIVTGSTIGWFIIQILKTHNKRNKGKKKEKKKRLDFLTVH
jgi:hypothetical protein